MFACRAQQHGFLLSQIIFALYKLTLWIHVVFQRLLDEDDAKVAADAMKELEMLMPSVSGVDSKSSKTR